MDNKQVEPVKSTTCNCIRDIEAKLREVHEKEYDVVGSVSFDVSIINIMTSAKTVLNIPYSFEYTNRNGNISVKKRIFIPSFCAFCGAKIDTRAKS